MLGVPGAARGKFLVGFGKLPATRPPSATRLGVKLLGGFSLAQRSATQPLRATILV